MNIYVFNENFEMQGIIDTFISLIWRREYYKAGTFELHLNLPDEPDDDRKAATIIALLQKRNILVKEDSLDEAVYIDDINLDEQDKETLVVSGYFIENFIERRIVWGQQSVVGNVDLVMKYFVDRNAVNPDEPKRVLPNLEIAPITNIPISANELHSYRNLAELIEELALKYDVGWRMLFDMTKRKYIFDVFEGRDLSVNQSINPQAIFALEYENVLNQSLKDSERNFRNTALIGGQGEGIDRKLATINNTAIGYERYELFVDAREISNTLQNENGTETPLTDGQYEKLLLEKGNSSLAETQRILTFQSGITVNSNLIYKRDFDLGNIVTIKNDRWGVLLNTRITTIEEVYENDLLDIRVNFGNNIPTIIDKIKQRTR